MRRKWNELFNRGHKPMEPSALDLSRQKTNGRSDGIEASDTEASSKSGGNSVVTTDKPRTESVKHTGSDAVKIPATLNEQSKVGRVQQLFSNIFDTEDQRPNNYDPYTPTDTGQHSSPVSNTHSVANLEITKKSYWEEALQRLAKQNPALFEKFQVIDKEVPRESDDLPTAIQNIIKNRQQDIDNRQWVLPFKVRGRVLKLDPHLDKIFRAIQAFKDVGTSLAGLDPIHASVPWACVSVILQVALNGSDQYATAVRGLSEISPLIAQYARIQVTYMEERNVSLQSEFEESLIDLYNKILEYEITMAFYFSKSFFVRTLRSVPKLDDWDGMLKEIKTLNAQCQAFKGIFDAEFESEIMHKLQMVERAVQGIQYRLYTVVGSRETQSLAADILNWISDETPGDDHDFILEKTRLNSVYHSTGQWLLDRLEFSSWSNSNKKTEMSVLWLRGSIGTGKTSLMARVIEGQLERICQSSEEGHKIAYFYCSKGQGNDDGNGPGAVLRSLIRQLAWIKVESSIAIPVKVAYEKNAADGFRKNFFSKNRCVNMLVELILYYDQVVFVIDAIDECSEPDQLLESLYQVRTQSEGKLRLLFSSRDHIELLEVFHNAATIEIGQHSTCADMSFFIETEVLRRDRNRLLNGKFPELEERLIKILKYRAQGMFRWVELQLAILYDPKSPYRLSRDIESRLNQLDQDVGIPKLNHLYDQFFEMNTKSDRYDRILAIKAYKFIMCSRRPLKLSELTIAVRTDRRGRQEDEIDEIYILNISRNLLVQDPATDTIRFAHASVQEYLASREKKPGEFEFSITAAHKQAFLTCITLVQTTQSLDNPVESGESEGEEYGRWRRTFEGYASIFWPVHYQLALTSGTEMENKKAKIKCNKYLYRFLFNEKYINRFESWGSIILRYTNVEKPSEKNYGQDLSIVNKLKDCTRTRSHKPSRLLLACVWGFPDLVKKCLKQGMGSHDLTMDGESALDLAIKYERDDIIKILRDYEFERPETETDDSLTAEILSDLDE